MDFTLLVLAGAVVIAAVVLALALRRPEAKPDARLDTVIAEQGKISGQFQQTVAAQAELQKLLSDRLDALNKHMGESLTDSATKTAATLSAIGARLTVIDEAQKNITALSDRVVSLQDILSDKQARGAWGQDRMEDIVRDQLPPDMFEFQGRLSNNSAPDCVIRIPGMGAAIVIDAKFPLEAFEALKAATNDAERKPAIAQLRNDVQKHIADIARKYLIPGEVQSPALMFVPSESVYAELHDAFPDVVQRARRAQVVIVSPHILWLAVNTIRALMRDAKMREQASRIQKEVGELLLDVKRLAERVGDLRKHFETTNKDIAQIEISANKIISRGEKIEAVELSAPEDETAKIAGPATTKL
jgi:DNA recombination protein RmuC